jgi:hypothetical protein
MRFSGNNHIQTKVMAFLLMGLLGNRLTAGTEAHYAAVSSLPKPVSSSLSVPFEVGEKFTYSVSWKVFEAGIATMTLVEKTLFQNEETYKINATVHSTGIVSTLFKVVDVFESFFHSRELCSRQIVKNIQEGRRHRNTVVAFDPKTGQARMEDKDLNRPDLPSKKTSAPIPGCVQDVVSALYLIRTKNLRVGDLIHFPINDGGRTYDVAVEIQAQEEVRTPAGAFQTLRLEPKVFGGLFKNKGRMFVWLTNDQEKMPVQLKAKINIGTITAALTQIDRRPLLGFHEPAKAGNRP